MMIESPQNEKIKYLTRLIENNQFRKKAKVFPLEGVQENERALKFGFEATAFYICQDLYFKTIPHHAPIHYISKNLYEKLAYRGSTEGIIGIYKVRKQNLTDFVPKEDCRIIIIEGIEKPGNLGAILRSCEAFGIDALILTNARIDIYNPNVMRSSVGCFFGMNIFESINEECWDFLQSNSFHLYTTFMNTSSESIKKVKFCSKSAIIFGTEHSGITNFWKNKGKNITIKTIGSIDSLNLSNSVAISCYELSAKK